MHRLFGPCRCRERGSAAFADVGEKGELGHDENRSTDVGDASVHLGFGIGKNAHGDRLGCRDTRIRLCISRCNANEGKETAFNPPRRLPIDFDRGSTDSLQDDAHPTFLVDSECTVHR